MATNSDNAVSAGDGETGGPLSRMFATVLLVLNSIGTIWIFVLMLVIMVDVFGRTALSRPLPGVAELVSLSIVGIVFLQIAHTLRSGRITRVDSLSDWLEDRWPRFAFVLEGVYSLMGATLFAVLFIACRPLFVNAWTNNEYAGVEGYVTYPFWPIRLVMLIGCACSVLQYLMFAWQHFGRAAGTSATAAGEGA